MKKLFLLCAAALTLAAHAEDITLDLTTATDFTSNAVVYETDGKAVWNGHTKDVWDLTYSESLKATQTRFTDISKKHDNLFDTQLCSITFYEEEK